MSNLVSRLVGEKKEWRAMEARAAGLPRDYRVVYEEIKGYLWKFAAGDGSDTVAVLKEVLAFFEESAAAGKRVLEVTGEDVAAFCDERRPGTPAYVDRWRAGLNRDVARRLGHAGSRG